MSSKDPQLTYFEVKELAKQHALELRRAAINDFWCGTIVSWVRDLVKTARRVCRSAPGLQRQPRAKTEELADQGTSQNLPAANPES